MARIERIGNATLYLGDSLNLILPKFDFVVTDPPYGLGHNFGATNNPLKPKQKDGNRWGKEWGPMIGDDEPFNPIPWLRWPGVMWGAHHFCANLPSGKVWLVWDKGVPEGMASSACELAWTSIPGGDVRRKAILWSGFRRKTEVREHYHPTQKPVVLMDWCIDVLKVASSETILDPYMGSGSTGVACIRRGIKFLGVEIDEKYFDVACTRLEDEVRRPDMLRRGVKVIAP